MQRRGFVSRFRIVLASANADTVSELNEFLQPFGYDVISAASGRDALSAIRSGPVDLVLVDYRLPDMPGIRLCQHLKQTPDTDVVPVVMLLPGQNREDRVRSLQAGADDFITRPFDDIELRARVRSLLRVKLLHQRLRNEKLLLEVRLRERTREIEELTLGLVAALEKATEFNDMDTGSHILRVCETSQLLARTIGLPDVMTEKIRRYASLHDIGKVAVPHHILKKQDKLTPEEWDEMKRHTLYGYELLVTARADVVAQNIAYCHHEKFDGTGYPQGLIGRQIPIEARIVALADVFDALLSPRCYKDPYPEEAALNVIYRDSGKHFDPDLVAAFKLRLSEIQEIRDRYRDGSDVG